MKLKLKTILTSAKAEVLLQSKYCLNKNSVEPLTTATYKVHLCKGTSEALLVDLCRVIFHYHQVPSTSSRSAVIDLQLLRVVFNASILKTGDKRRPMNNKLDHFTQKERN